LSAAVISSAAAKEKININKENKKGDGREQIMLDKCV